MDLVAGIDGGATRTRAIIARLDGTIIGSGSAGSANVFDLGAESAASVMREAVLAAWRVANIGEFSPAHGFASVFAGAAGAGSPRDQAALAKALAKLLHTSRERCRADHDLRIALAGALAGAPGAVLVAGTGSACFGRAADGTTARAGGWGKLLDDGGSGHWLGLQAMRAVVRTADGREEGAELAASVQAALAVDSPREMLQQLHGGALERATIARLAPLVLGAAAAGDRVAIAIVDRGASELAEMVAAVFRQMEARAAPIQRLGAAGGVLENDAWFRARVQQAIARATSSAVALEAPALMPCAGAVLLALSLAGAPANEATIARLRAGA